MFWRYTPPTHGIRSKLKRVRDSGLVSKRILGRQGGQDPINMTTMTNSGKASDPNLDGRSLCPGHASRYSRASDGTRVCTLPYPHPSEYFHLTASKAAMNPFCAELLWQDALRRSPVDERWCEKCQCVWLEFLLTKIQDAEHTTNQIHARRENKGKYTARDGLGPREFTLTYGNHFDNDEAAQAAMTQAIQRLTKYYKDEIIEFHAVGEFTSAGRAHVHGWYHLDGGRKITDKNFRRAYPPWNPKRKLGKGHEGGHHATIDRVSDFAGYAEKHLEEAWLKIDINADDPSSPSAPSRILEEVHDSLEEGHHGPPGGEESGSESSEGGRHDR